MKKSEEELEILPDEVVKKLKETKMKNILSTINHEEFRTYGELRALSNMVKKISEELEIPIEVVTDELLRSKTPSYEVENKRIRKAKEDRNLYMMIFIGIIIILLCYCYG